METDSRPIQRTHSFFRAVVCFGGHARPPRRRGCRRRPPPLTSGWLRFLGGQTCRRRRLATTPAAPTTAAGLGIVRQLSSNIRQVQHAHLSRQNPIDPHDRLATAADDAHDDRGPPHVRALEDEHLVEEVSSIHVRFMHFPIPMAKTMYVRAKSTKHKQVPPASKVRSRLA